MYTNRDVVIRANTFARAICSEQLEPIFYSNDNPSFVFIIFSSTIPLPIVTLVVLLLAVRKMNDNIIGTFARPTSHGTVVGAVLTGSVISIAILVLNIHVCSIVANGDHEYSVHIEGMSINLSIVFATLALNVIFILPLVLCIFYIIIFHNGRQLIKGSQVCSLQPCVTRVIRFVIGKNTFNKIAELSKNDIIALMFPIMIASPILCISTHIVYILLAFLTEPSKCTTTFLIYYIVMVYFFVTFRKVYNFHSRTSFSFSLSKRGRNEDSSRKSNNAIELEVVGGEVPPPKESSDNSKRSAVDPKSDSVFSGHHKEHINPQAFGLLVLYGVFLTGIAAIILLNFLLLPFSSEQLVIYIFHLFQLIVVLVSTQLAYKLLFDGGFSLESVVKKFKDVYAARGSNETLATIVRQKHEELSDVAGEFAAEFTDVMVQKITE